MEKKTMGALIAVLRRANGMTQRELAERLNVSDKAVSRWERDECAPDLSLIPVIADLFGITTDELLRGERRSGAESTEESAWRRERSERQLRHLMASRLAALKEKSMIALGILAGGYLTALLCNFAFHHAELGFFLSLVFYGTAMIWEVIHLRRSSLGDEEDYDAEKRTAYQNGVTLTGKKFFFLLWMLLGATVPFLFVPVMTSVTPAGLTLPMYISLMLLTAFPFLAIWHFADLFAICPVLAEKKLLTMTEREAQRNKNMKRLLLKTTVICVVIATVLGITAGVFLNIVSYSRQIVFRTYEEFKHFMETPMEYRGTELVEIDAAEESERSPVHTITDENGNVVCEYEWRNQTVFRIEPEGYYGGLPIRVYSSNGYRAIVRISDEIGISAFFGVFLTVIVSTAVYLRKAKKYA